MFKLILASILAFSAFAAEGDTKLPKEAETAISKAIDGNLVEATKLYDQYQAALAKANVKVLASLETVKKDLNDTKKFTSMSIADRAKAIEEVDAKIKDIKGGALGERVASNKTADLLGDEKVQLQGKGLVAFLKDNSKWKMNETDTLVFDVKNMKASIVNADKTLYTANISIEKGIVKFATNTIEFNSTTNTTATFKWQGGNTAEITLIKD